MEEKICIIGSGNLATQLALALNHRNVNISQIVSRNIENAKLLANKIDTKYSNKLSDIDPNSTIIILAVNDDSISDILKKIDFKDKIIAHTAGSIDINIIPEKIENKGVFYPLQTFKKDTQVDFKTIPIFIESNNSETNIRLKALANSISNQVYEATSEQRLKLHIAAVFACNFSNHLFSIAHNLLEDTDHGFQALLPLIKETCNKVISGENPNKVQTGPALRDDKKTMEKHIAQLSDNDSLSKLYKFMSNRIFETKKNYE